MKFHIRKFLLTAILLIIVGLGVWWWFSEGDEARIHKNLDTIIGLISKQGEENPVMGMIGLAKLENYLVEQPSIEIPGRMSRMTDRRELIAQAASLRTQTRIIQARVLERELLLHDNRESAVMSGVGQVWLDYTHGEQKLYSARYRLQWIKDGEGDWRLKESEVTKVLINGEQVSEERWKSQDFGEK